MGVAEYVNQDAVNEMTDVYDGRLIFTLLCCFWKVGPLAAEDVVLHLVDRKYIQLHSPYRQPQNTEQL